MNWKEKLNVKAKEIASVYEDYTASACDVELSCIEMADWLENELEKNRLAACDSQTSEEREREEEFVNLFLKENHRVPTISDAIEYVRKTMIDRSCELYTNELRQMGRLLVLTCGDNDAAGLIDIEHSTNDFRKSLER